MAWDPTGRNGSASNNDGPQGKDGPSIRESMHQGRNLDAYDAFRAMTGQEATHRDAKWKADPVPSRPSGGGSVGVSAGVVPPVAGTPATSGPGGTGAVKPGSAQAGPGLPSPAKPGGKLPPMTTKIKDEVTGGYVGISWLPNPWFSDVDKFWEPRMGEPGEWLGGIVNIGADVAFNTYRLGDYFSSEFKGAKPEDWRREAHDTIRNGGMGGMIDSMTRHNNDQWVDPDTPFTSLAF